MSGSSNSLHDLLHQANRGERLGDNDELQEDGMDTNETNDNTSRRTHGIENPSDNPRPPVLPRSSFMPRDDTSMREQRIITKSKFVDMKILMKGEDLIYDMDFDMNRIILAGQFMRMITPSKKDDSIGWFKRSKGQQTQSNSSHYDRLLFFRELTETDQDKNNKIFVIMQNFNSNENLFNRFPNARDNGKFTIGSILLIVNPRPITKYMNQIPMIETEEQAILAHTMILPKVSLMDDLDAHEMKAFHCRRSQLNIRRVVFLETKCSGLFCDRQNIDQYTSKACGCFSHKSSRSNIASLQTIIFGIDGGKKKMMEKFSSMQFLSLFCKGYMSLDIRASRLQLGYEAYDDYLDAQKDILDLINEDGGFDITGWCKRGVINDISLIGQQGGNNTVNNNSKDQQSGDNKVLSEEVTTHVVQVMPYNRDYLDESTVRGKNLKELQFDLSSL